MVRIGHSECRTLLLRDNDPNRPPPEVTFDEHFTLTVGGETLVLDFHGPNHTPDNIFIRAPAQQTLMLVDVIFPRWVPFKELAVSQDIPDWIKAQDIALSLPWHTLVAGHLGRLGTRDDAELQIAYVADLLASARATWRAWIRRRSSRNTGTMPGRSSRSTSTRRRPRRPPR